MFMQVISVQVGGSFNDSFGRKWKIVKKFDDPNASVFGNIEQWYCEHLDVSGAKLTACFDKTAMINLQNPVSINEAIIQPNISA
jgi:hypothetical protein